MARKTVSGKAFDVSILRRIYSFVGPYKGKFRLAAFLTLLIAFLSPIRPLLVQETIDNYIIRFDESGLLRMTLIMIALLFIQTVIQYFHTYITSWLGQAVIKDIRV